MEDCPYCSRCRLYHRFIIKETKFSEWSACRHQSRLCSYVASKIGFKLFATNGPWSPFKKSAKHFKILQFFCIPRKPVLKIRWLVFGFMGKWEPEIFSIGSRRKRQAERDLKALYSMYVFTVSLVKYRLACGLYARGSTTEPSPESFQ